MICKTHRSLITTKNNSISLVVTNLFSCDNIGIRVFGNAEESVAMPADPVPSNDGTMDYNQPQPSADGNADSPGGSEIPDDLIL